MLKKILSGYLPRSRSKIEVIDHGIREIADLNIHQSSKIDKKYPTIKNKNLILVFGHFSPRKDYEYLIAEFGKVVQKNKLSRWVLALVGDVQPEFSDYWDKIQTLISEMNLKKQVITTGFVKDEEIDQFYRKAKVVLIPAIISFNTSGALSLALAYKKPLLVANVKPLSKEIEDNSYGLLYDKKGNLSLQKQLLILMKDSKIYKRLAKDLGNNVEKRFWSKIAKQHYNLYKQLFS